MSIKSNRPLQLPHLNVGFTFLEIMIVMLMIGLLASLAAPHVINMVVKGKEAVLKENLLITRKSLDDYYSDKGLYPQDLDALVEDKYLRTLPWDPITRSDNDWTTVDSEDEEITGIADIKSASSAQARDGTYYSDW